MIFLAIAREIGKRKRAGCCCLSLEHSTDRYVSERPAGASWWKWLQETALRGGFWERKQHDLIINKIIITH